VPPPIPLITWEKTALVAVKIKLKRMGKIRAPFYRVVVADSRTKRDGRAIEEIGKYHPKSDPSFIEISSERAQYWLSVGAQPTDPVRKLLQITGDWQKFRGEPGAEGTLQMPKPKPNKAELFAEVAGKQARADDGSTTPRGGGRARKADADGDSKPRRSGGAKRSEAKTEVKAEPKAEAKAEPKAEAPAEAKAEAPAEAKVEAPAEAPAEAKVEAKAEAPAEAKAEAPAEAKAEAPAEAAAKEAPAAAAPAAAAPAAAAPAAEAPAAEAAESGSEG
jgi:small subunit ribosomal protein S16